MDVWEKLSFYCAGCLVAYKRRILALIAGTNNW